MVRMSDILKKATEKEKEAKEKKEKKIIQPKPQKPSSSAKPPTLPSKPIKFAKKGMKAEDKAPEAKKLGEPVAEQKPEVELPPPEKVEAPKVRISPVVMKRAKAAQSDESIKLYERSISLMREILKKNINPESIDAKHVTVQTETIIEQLGLGNEKLLELALTREPEDENYLYCHSVNVCIYSIAIGLGLGYDKLKLTELGISALVHDIGMTEYLHLTNQSRKLTAGELKEIKKHPLRGTEILENVKNLKKVALYAVHQQHERENGTGYPRRLKKGSISEYAGIISIVDTFEAMMHPRAHRNEFLPIEALQKILKDKKAFKRKLIKILIERIGIFPIGSFVELSTKWIGQVIKLNREVPLRPVIKIIYEADGERPEETKIVDLITQPNVHIRKGIRKKELITLPFIK